MASMGRTLITRVTKAKATKDQEANRNSSHSQGKRGRDTYEDDKREREVKQKTWNADGKTTAENWSKSMLVRTYMRNLSLEQAKTLLETLKQADIDFQYKMNSVPLKAGMKLLTIIFCTCTRPSACQLT
jgi:hypothetical protein